MGASILNPSRYQLLRRYYLLLLVSGLVASPWAGAQITRISETQAGIQANHDSYEASISDDGSVIAFRTSASNFLAGDTNKKPEIFVRDFNTNVLELVNVETDGDIQELSYYRNVHGPSISDDGNRIAYNGHNGYLGVFLRDRSTQTLVEILKTSFTTNNVDRRARLEPFLAGDGNSVVFYADTGFQVSEPPSARPLGDDNPPYVHDVFWYDYETSPTPRAERLSRPDFSADTSCIAVEDCPEGDNDSFTASVSDDGRRVAFYSHAGNLVPDDDNDFADIFVKFRFDALNQYQGIAGAIVRVSESSAGVQADGPSMDGVISGNGQFVVFRSRATNLVSGDSNGNWDIFVHDLNTATTERVSVSSTGAQSNHDSFSPSISDDGRFVVFRSNASNLVIDDTNARFDIFVHDRDTGSTERVSRPTGGESNGHSYAPVISGDGQWIAFESDATNLILNDTNGARDIFRTQNPLAGGLR